MAPRRCIVAASRCGHRVEFYFCGCSIGSTLRRSTLMSTRGKRMQTNVNLTRERVARDGLLAWWLAVWIALLACPGISVCAERADTTSNRQDPADRTGHAYGANFATFSPDGKTMMSAGKTLKLWDVASGEVLKTFRWQEDQVTCSTIAGGHSCPSAGSSSAHRAAFTCVAFS